MFSSGRKEKKPKPSEEKKPKPRAYALAALSTSSKRRKVLEDQEAERVKQEGSATAAVMKMPHSASNTVKPDSGTPLSNVEKLRRRKSLSPARQRSVQISRFINLHSRQLF